LSPSGHFDADAAWPPAVRCPHATSSSASISNCRAPHDLAVEVGDLTVVARAVEQRLGKLFLERLNAAAVTC
jgi:hypothetical protein